MALSRKRVLSNKCKNEDDKMAIRESEVHSTNEASNDCGGKGLR